jgi:hypothetical protein
MPTFYLLAELQCTADLPKHTAGIVAAEREKKAAAQNRTQQRCGEGNWASPSGIRPHPE